MIPSDDDFNLMVTIQALTRIFKDPTLAVQHDMVMQAIMYVYLQFPWSKMCPFP